MLHHSINKTMIIVMLGVMFHSPAEQYCSPVKNQFQTNSTN